MKVRPEDLLVSYKKWPTPPLLLHLAGRVASFSPECEICQSLTIQIEQLDRNLCAYPGVMKSIIGHLKRSHGLVEKRHYVKRCVLISFSAGISLVLFGLILLSFGIILLAWNITLIALFIRMIFSYTIGYFLDKRSEKLGRVI